MNRLLHRPDQQADVAAGGLGLEAQLSVGQYFVKGGHFQLLVLTAGNRLGQQHDVAYDGVELLRSLDNMFELLADGCIAMAPQLLTDHRGEADERAQRCLHFVAQHLQHGALGAACRLRLGFGKSQRPLGVAIAHDKLCVVQELRPIDRLGQE